MLRFMGRFVNPHLRDTRRSLWDLFLWIVGSYDDSMPRLAPPAEFAYPGNPKGFVRNAPSAVWIGHSTYLLEIGGVVILTDPVWDMHCSPIPLKAFRRYSEPPIALEDLPPVDVVLLSHNHYDHLDAKTVKILSQFHPQIEWIVPEGVGKWFKRRGITSVKEIGWWKEYEGKAGKITAVPTQHFSGRSLWDKNRTHWNGYVVEIEGKKLYFTGDTGYNDKDFKAIGKQFGGMDLSLIPIGAYLPQKFMQPVHVNPYEAVQIHLDVLSKLSLGMHWNTFRLSEEHVDRPPYDLYLAMKEKQVDFDSFLPVDIGTYVNF